MLEEIEGIGPARRKALLRAFGSLEGIRDADLESLSRAPSMNRGSAEKVYAFFHPQEEKSAADGYGQPAETPSSSEGGENR
jgi:excinuclease ABC subunit C